MMLGWSPLGFSKHVKHRCTGAIVIHFPEQETESCFAINKPIYTPNINVNM